MRFALVLVAALLSLLLLAPAPALAAKTVTCRSGQVPVTAGKKTTCRPLAKALPQPRAIDLRLAQLQEVLRFDPAKAVHGKKRKRARTLQSGFGAAGKRLQKTLLKTLPKALAFIDRKGGARSSRLPAGPALASSGCDVGPAGPTGQTDGASVGTLGENGGYIDAGAGGGLRVRVTFVSCRGPNNFHIPDCPTANGGVDTNGTGEFRATVEIWNGDTFVSRNSSTFEDRAKAHGEVGPDAKLKFIDVEHTQEVFIVASGGIVIRGGVTRKVRIAMPGGGYDPAGASVRYFGDSISSDSGATSFASTVASVLSAYRGAEPRWSTFNPSGGYCAEPVFAPDSNTLKLKKGDKNQLAVYAKARQDGGRATAARWTLLSPTNATFSPGSSENPAANFSYTVTNAPKGGEVRVTVKFTSTAGVGEKSWTQPTDAGSIDEISGTFTWRTEFVGSVFEASGNARFVRSTPAILSPPEGDFKLADGLYTSTASGSAAQLVTNQCSMRGSGQFALEKQSSLTVFSSAFNEEPPYSYGLSISSEIVSPTELPMIEIETYGCSSSAQELEGDRFPYPATMSLSTPQPYTSEDGIVYSDTFTQDQGGAKLFETWHFEAKP